MNLLAVLARTSFLFALLGISSCGSGDTREPELSGAITSLGYTVIRPPSKLMPPGSIVSVSTTEPFQARVICSSSGALGDITPAESATQSSEWSRKTKAGFNVSADVTAKLNARLGAQHVKNISLSLSNTRVFELTDEAVIQAAMNGSLSTACAAALKARADASDHLTMIRSVLQADVAYTMQFSDELSADAKTAALKAAAIELSANYSRDGDNTITGTALFFGVLDDTVMLQELQQYGEGKGVAAADPNPDSARSIMGSEVQIQF